MWAESINVMGDGRVSCPFCGERHYLCGGKPIFCKCGARYVPRKQKWLEGKPRATNADRIRSMTDEELAEFIEGLYLDGFCDFICGGRCEELPSTRATAHLACKELIRDWLKQPVGGAE